MNPGVYRNLDFAAYLAIPAISNTRMGLVLKSPKHYAADANMDDQAKPLVIGQLCHCGRLEPMALAERYAVMPDYHLHDDNVTDAGKPSQSKTTRHYKEKAADFAATNKDKQVVPAEWYAEVKEIVASLYADKLSNELFNAPGDTELTLVWRDEESGLLCKARFDKCIPSRQVFVDLKTTADLSKFTRAIANYGYHRQMAHYQEGWAALNGGDLLDPWIVAVEKCRPFCVMAAPLDEEAVMAGYSQRRKALNLIRDCMATGDWPGPAAPKVWRVPEYALLEE